MNKLLSLQMLNYYTARLKAYIQSLIDGLRDYVDECASWQEYD